MNIQFFKMVSNAAFSNPFSAQRVEIDRLITGAAENAAWDDMLQPLLQKLDKEIRSLNNVRDMVAQRETDAEAQSVAISILFLVYHENMLGFDALIEEQMAAGDEPCKAPLAFQCMAKIVDYGFPHTVACRYVAMFYQIRRAYYFIVRGLVGESPCMKKLRAQLWNNIFTHNSSWYAQCLWDRMEDFSTLLLGETGTGKGAAAAAIGRSGFIPFNPTTQKFEESFTRAFVAINLSQYPASLIESELFGHRKGAFTGAMEKHDGIFARCSPHGAIFLDEIGDVSVPLQIKLLQVLQERTFSPVGSHDKIRFRGRVIAATNKPVDALRRKGTFRDDFYYRLCSDLITMPPLRLRIRERPTELERLARHLQERICGCELKLPIIDKLQQEVSSHYPWPGNVRELEQAIRRIILTGRYDGEANTKEPFEPKSAKEIMIHRCKELYQLHANYGEVARQLDLDWRTVKKYATAPARA